VSHRNTPRATKAEDAEKTIESKKPTKRAGTHDSAQRSTFCSAKQDAAKNHGIGPAECCAPFGWVEAQIERTAIFVHF